MLLRESQIVFNILKRLSEDSRISMEDLGKSIGISRQYAAKTVRKMQEKGIIRQYATLLNSAAFQTYFLEFKTNPREPQIADSLRQIPNVHTLDGIIGDFSLIAKIIARNQSEFACILEQIDKFMTKSHFHVYRVINTIKCFKESGENIVEETPTLMNLEDETILKKIRILNQRINITELAKQTEIGVTQSTLSKKLEKYLQIGLVRKYTLCIDPAFLHLETKFILRIKPLSLDQYTIIAGMIARKFPEVIDLYRTGEDFGLLAIVRTQDITAYNQFLRKLYQTVDVEDTHTVLVIEEQKPSILPVYEKDYALIQ